MVELPEIEAISDHEAPLSLDMRMLPPVKVFPGTDGPTAALMA